jgi:hypothetical protein
MICRGISTDRLQDCKTVHQLRNALSQVNGTLARKVTIVTKGDSARMTGSRLLFVPSTDLAVAGAHGSDARSAISSFAGATLFRAKSAEGKSGQELLEQARVAAGKKR